MAAPPKKLIRDPRTAKILGVSPSTLANARCTGQGVFAELPFYQMGRSIRYDEAEVRAFAARHRIEPSQDPAAADLEAVAGDIFGVKLGPRR